MPTSLFRDTPIRNQSVLFWALLGRPAACGAGRPRLWAAETPLRQKAGIRMAWLRIGRHIYIHGGGDAACIPACIHNVTCPYGHMQRPNHSACLCQRTKGTYMYTEQPVNRTSWFSYLRMCPTMLFMYDAAALVMARSLCHTCSLPWGICWEKRDNSSDGARCVCDEVSFCGGLTTALHLQNR